MNAVVTQFLTPKTLNLKRYPMTSKFLSEEQQAELDILGDVAVWYCPSVGTNEESVVT